MQTRWDTVRRLVLERDQSGWTTFSVMERSCESTTATSLAGESTTATISKMLLSSAHVCPSLLPLPPLFYSGTSDKGPSEIGTTSLQRTLVAAPC